MSLGYAGRDRQRPERVRTRPAPSNPRHSWLLDLQRRAGNSAVAALVVQRVPLSKDEEYFLRSASDRLDAAGARAAIEEMSAFEAAKWRASVAQLTGGALDSAYKQLAEAWRKRQSQKPKPPVPARTDLATWDDLPERDRQFLDGIWADLGRLGATFDKNLLLNYWRASAAKLGDDWAKKVKAPWPETPPPKPSAEFRQYASDVKVFNYQAEEMKAVWSELEWIWRQRTSAVATYQLRVYLNPLPQYAGEVLGAIPLEGLGRPAAKVGSYEIVSRYRDSLVVYLDGSSLAEAEAKAETICEWLRTYQATKRHYFVDEVPAFTKPVGGLRGVGVGEDPGDTRSFTQVRQDVVEEALRNAGGDAATFKKLVLAGFRKERIPANAPWKQRSDKQKSV